MSSLHRPQRAGRRLSKLAVVGLVVLAVGLGGLAWVGYQLVGSNVVSNLAFDTQRDELRSEWEQQGDGPATSSSPSPAKGTQMATPTATPSVAPMEGEAIALLRIPRFGSDYEVPILAGTQLDVLARGVGHYSSTAGPGQVGNFAVAGHRITHGQPFAKLLDLRKGDQVVVETRAAVYTYVLDVAPRDLTVKDDADWVLDPVPDQPAAKPTSALLTLTTCQDLFRTADRSVGFGHLTSTRNKG